MEDPVLTPVEDVPGPSGHAAGVQTAGRGSGSQPESAKNRCGVVGKDHEVQTPLPLDDQRGVCMEMARS